MSSHDLPDLPRLKRTAKALKKACAAGDADARRRVHDVLPELAVVRHADALHVIAREYGYASWPRLKFAVEHGGQDRATRARTLQRALFFGQAWIVDALLNADPSLADDDPALRIALLDDAWVVPWLNADPARATRPLGRRSPLLHLAFSHHHRAAPERRDGMLRIAHRLLDLGADPNDGYAPDPKGEHRLSALYGALAHADNLPLAELLLDAGAVPDDDESLYHATELPHLEGLALLLRHGATITGTNALLRALDFCDGEKVRLLLDAGADPNEPVHQHPSGLPMQGVLPLHQAARRGCSEPVVTALLDAGADPRARWQDRTPYGTARLFGHAHVADLLASRAAAEPLDATTAALARCAEGTPADPALDPATLSEEDRRLPVRVAADPAGLPHLRALLASGLSAEVEDEMGLTPLLIALWEGLPDHVAYLLDQPHDLAHVNAYGGDALGTLIHGSEFCRASGRDHVACARLLRAAGGREATEAEIRACGSEELAAFLEEPSFDEPAT